MARLQGRKLRQLRNRKKIVGSGLRPRLNIFRSNKHIVVQLINDETHHTITSSSTKELGLNNNSIQEAKLVGESIAKKAKEAGITQVVFDRAGYKYHGKVKALADAAREHGLEF